MKFFKKRTDTKNPDSPFQFRWIEHENLAELTKCYAQVDQFFDEHIDDPTRFRLSNAPTEEDKNNAVLVVYKDNVMVGAIWAGAPFAEARQAKALGNLQGQSAKMDGLSESMIDHTWMLFDLAVAPEFRGRGVARKLLLTILDDAKRRGKQFIWGVATPDSIGFYARTSMNVMPAEGALVLSQIQADPRTTEPGVYALPITGESRWMFSQLQKKRRHIDIGYVDQTRLG